MAVVFLVTALGVVLRGIFDAATLGDAGAAPGIAAFLVATAIVLVYDYNPSPRDLPGAPRAGIDTPE